MNINCSKYLNLLKKDLLISKNMIFLLVYFFIVILVFPLIFGNNLIGDMLNMIATVTFIEMITFGSQQVLISEKCKGNELIITTSYTRKDIIYSRHVFFYLLSLICMICSFAMAAILYPNLEMNFFVILEYVFMVCTGSALLVTLTFKMKSNLSYTVVAFVFALPILALINTVEFINAIINPAITCTLLLLLSAIISFISIKLSEKIYLNKSL